MSQMAGFDPDTAFGAMFAHMMRMRQSEDDLNDDDDLKTSNASANLDDDGMDAGGQAGGNFHRNAPQFEDDVSSHASAPQQAQPIDESDDSLPALGGANSNFFKLIERDAKKNPHRQTVEDADQDDEGGAGAAAAKPKRTFGNKVKGFFKGAGRMAQGVWGLGKNLTGYNLLRHGLIGANFRRGKLNKNLKKWNAMGKTEQERFTHRDAWKIQGKLSRNRMMLANHRHYYSGLKMVNEFRRGAGKAYLGAEEPLPKFFHGE